MGDFQLLINFLIRFFLHFNKLHEGQKNIIHIYPILWIVEICNLVFQTSPQYIDNYIHCFVSVRVFSDKCFQICLQIICPNGRKSRVGVFLWLFTPVRLQFDFFNYGKVTMHYMLRCSLGRFLSQKMFISKVLFLSEKKIYLSRSSCFYKLMTQILHPQNCSK